MKALFEHFQTFDVGKFLKAFPHAMDHVENLEKIQKYSYKNKIIALVSLVHSSCLSRWPRNKEGVYNNEQLEFLGDAQIGYFIAQQSMLRYPRFLEGQLSQLRASLVGTHNLAKLSKACGLHACILLGDGKLNQIGPGDSVLAGLFESVTAALYLDGGFQVAQNWMLFQFSEDLDRAPFILEQVNPRTLLQQWVQSFTTLVPHYKIMDMGESPSEPLFTAVVYVGDLELARASGKNKKQAMLAAARRAMELKEQNLLTEKMITI